MVDEALYRVAQEALHNTIKHVRASYVQVAPECAVDTITLQISDDGAGFDPTGFFPGHLGLKSMRERAERLGGTLEIESAPRGKGTRLLARVPSGK
jgi:signal transduction histidine kinase